ncbi:G2/mitotic-specific cyclin S13-6 [Ranunculus cassubicifolius]
MATRPVGVKHGGNSRRVPLGDIGNLITVTKTNLGSHQEQVAGGGEKNNKKVPILVAKVVQKIRPDTDDGSLKKRKVQTYTSVLAARSKAGCAQIARSKDTIVDIDAADATNQLAAVEYVEDLYKFYKLSESSSVVHDYMESQPEINTRMRAILVDWLIEVHNKFELAPETLYLTIYIVDRYLSVTSVLRKELQLVGISAMLIASKYEEIWAPAVNDFVCVCDGIYSRDQVLMMEKSILKKLEWSLTVPTPYVFLVRFIKAALPDQEMENMVFFYAELGLMHYATILYCPSMLSASAVYAARCTLNKSPFWNETLKFHTGYAEDQLIDCAKILVNLHAGTTLQKLQVVHRKYSSPQRNAVALHAPAKIFVAQ